MANDQPVNPPGHAGRAAKENARPAAPLLWQICAAIVCCAMISWCSTAVASGARVRKEERELYSSSWSVPDGDFNLDFLDFEWESVLTDLGVNSTQMLWSLLDDNQTAVEPLGVAQPTTKRRWFCRGGGNGGSGSRDQAPRRRNAKNQDQADAGRWRWLTRLFRRRPAGPAARGAKGGPGESRADLVKALRAELEEIPGMVELAEQAAFPLDPPTLTRYLEVNFWQLARPDGRRVADLVADTVQWRVDNHVAALSRGDFSEPTLVKQMYVNGVDRAGRPVVLYSPISSCPAPLAESLQYLVFNLEEALRVGATLEEYTVIVDLAFVGPVPPVATVKAAFEVMAKHYPMRSGHILLVNGGAMVQLLWRILEPAVPERTRSKVQIVPAGDEARVLAELIDPAQLEERFAGGKLPVPPEFEGGPLGDATVPQTPTPPKTRKPSQQRGKRRRAAEPNTNSTPGPS